MVTEPMQKGLFSEASGGASTLAWERLLWSLQPLTTLIVAVGWVLNPAVADQQNLYTAMMIGFGIGIGIALLGAWPYVQKYILQGFETGVYRYNRVPQEFYWGAKTKVLFRKEKGRP